MKARRGVNMRAWVQLSSTHVKICVWQHTSVTLVLTLADSWNSLDRQLRWMSEHQVQWKTLPSLSWETMRWKVTEKDIQGQPLAFTCMCMNIHVCTHSHTHKYTHIYVLHTNTYKNGSRKVWREKQIQKRKENYRT